MTYQLTENDLAYISANKEMPPEDAAFQAAIKLMEAQQYMNYCKDDIRCKNNLSNAKDCAHYAVKNLISCLRLLTIANCNHLIIKYDLHNQISFWQKTEEQERETFKKMCQFTSILF